MLLRKLLQRCRVNVSNNGWSSDELKNLGESLCSAVWNMHGRMFISYVTHFSISTLA